MGWKLEPLKNSYLNYPQKYAIVYLIALVAMTFYLHNHDHQMGKKKFAELPCNFFPLSIISDTTDLQLAFH